MISCGARLAPFDIQEVRDVTAYDELQLDTLGDKKTALFLIMSDTDSTFNFLISMIYTQLFNLLCEKADDVYGGRLPVHVRCLIDEAANIGQIPNLEKLVATIRSREISACLVLQAQSQLKAIYALDEIGHNPYELAAYLTVVFEDYTREEVQAELVRLFEEQYDLELDEEVEIRSYTTTDEDGNTSTVYYEYRILNVTLTNYGLGNVIASSRLTAEQWERYKVLLETLGNRSYLFGEDVSSAPGGGGEYTDYDIPGEALTDTAFANMVREAEKYLGYPYVWGGSSPSTSFDCSGFVSWVINNCGNGWSVGRQTANGLKNLCDIIPPSEAKPGDLIFFQGTYNTSGASHVGIYVGNGMMIHCGDPISYASIETNYWQQHFYCFGRIP